MAEIRVKKLITIQLTLNRKESEYIHDLMRNYLSDGPDSENPEHTEIRENIFKLLDDTLSYN